MYNSLLHKRLQCTVDRYPVIFFACAGFNIMVRKRVSRLQKNIEYYPAAIGHAELTFL